VSRQAIAESLRSVMGLVMKLPGSTTRTLAALAGRPRCRATAWRAKAAQLGSWMKGYRADDLFRPTHARTGRVGADGRPAWPI
jgi:hypothetical protein